MKITPLTGQVLVEILPEPTETDTGIAIPEYDMTPEDHQRAARNPSPPPPHRGIVRAVGQWPKTKSGLMRMPEYGIGAMVVVPARAGLELQHYKRYRMIQQREVLAVLT